MEQTLDRENFEPTPENQLEWTYAPDDLPRRRFIVILASLGAGAAGLFLFGHWAMALVGFSVVIFSTLEVLSPPQFRLNSRGVRSKVGISVTEIGWDKVKRIQMDNQGVLISPLVAPTRLDAFRGVYVRFVGNKDEILVKIREFWDGDIQTVADGESVAHR